MRFEKTNRNRFLALAAILVLCMASVVTVAYAYNAVYNDSVDEKEIDYSSELSYVVITSENGIEYTSDRISFSVNAEYGTVSIGTTTVYGRTGIDFPASDDYKIGGDDPYSMTVPLGKLKIKNESSVQIISSLEPTFTLSTPDSGKTYAFVPDGARMWFGDSNGNIIPTITVSPYGDVEVYAYLTAQVNSAIVPPEIIDTDPKSYMESKGFTYNDTTHNFTGTVYLNPLTIVSIRLSGSFEAQSSLDAEQVQALKEAAENDPNTTVVLKTDAGASIKLNVAAIEQLGDEGFTFTATETGGVYSLNLGNNTFGGDDSVLTVTLPYSGTAGPAYAVYLDSEGNEISVTDAVVNADGTVTFQTNHLSDYSITAEEPTGVVASVTYGSGLVAKFFGFNDVGLFGSDLDIVLLNDVTGNLTLVGGSKIKFDTKEHEFDGFYVKSGVSETFPAELEIKGVSALQAIARSVNTFTNGVPTNNFENVTVLLGEDFNLSGIDWEPIGDADAFYRKSFWGVFDGQNHTIRNMKVTSTESINSVAGFFGSLYTAQVRNINFDNATVSGNHYAAVLSAYAGLSDTIPCSFIENIHVSNSTVTSKAVTSRADSEGDKVGGIVGYCASSITGCSVSNTVIKGYRDIGGITGMTVGASVVKNNTISDVTITVDASYNYKNYTSSSDFDANSLIGERSAITVADGNSGSATIEFVGITFSAAIGDIQYTTLDSALMSGDNLVIQLYSGTHTVDQGKSKQNVTICGPSDHSAVIQIQHESSENIDYGFDSSKVTFKNITFLSDSMSTSYPGYDYGFARLSGTYEDCIFNGTYTTYSGAQMFKECTFNVTGDIYNLWTWGANSVLLNKCTLNCDGKAVLLYGMQNTELTVTECIFNDNGTVSDKAAIEIGNDYGVAYTLTVSETTVNGFDVNPTGVCTYTTLWANKNSMTGDKLSVKVDGIEVYGTNGLLVPIYNASDLQSLAVNVNKSSVDTITVRLMNDIDLQGVSWTPIGVLDSSPAGIFNGTFDGQNHTVSNLTSDDRRGYSSTAGFFGGIGSATVKNVTFKNAYVTSNHYAAVVCGYVNSECTFENVSVKNSTIVSCPNLMAENEYDNGDKAGAIAGYAINATLNGCSVENVSLQAFRDVGCLIGYAGTASITGTTVDGTNSIIVDQVTGYYPGKAINCGEAIGICTSCTGSPAMNGTVNVTVLVNKDESFLKATQLDLDVINILLKGDVTYDVSKDYGLGSSETSAIYVSGKNRDGETDYSLTFDKMGSNQACWYAWTTNANAVLDLSDLVLKKTDNGTYTWDCRDIRFNCNVVLENVTAPALAFDKKATLDGCTVTESDEKADVYLIWIVAGADVTVKDCQIIGVNSSASNTTRAIAIKDQYVEGPTLTKLSVSGTTFVSEKKAAVLVTTKGGAEINWGEGNDISSVAADTTNPIWYDKDPTYSEYKSLVEVTGCTMITEP